MNFELPDIDTTEDHPQEVANIVLVDRPAEAIQASEQPIMAATSTIAASPSRSNVVPSGHPPVSGSGEQTSCPFAALSMALDSMAGGEGNTAPGKGKSTEKKTRRFHQDPIETD
jgi:hypothetical protein